MILKKNSVKKILNFLNRIKFKLEVKQITGLYNNIKSNLNI